MRRRVLIGFSGLLCLCLLHNAAFAESSDNILAPTSQKVVGDEDKEFNAAFKVWLSHRYDEGTKMLKEFSKKHPGSRWAAEADLHVGCNSVFTHKYDEAKAIFNDLVKKHPGSLIDIKAKIRLGNIFERTNNPDEAIRQYGAILKMNPPGDQFKYANYRIRALAKRKHFRQAFIRCGPVALAECLRSLGKTREAYEAREMNVGENGVSLYDLALQAEKLGVQAQTVDMSIDKLITAKLPILAHVRGNHFIAVLDIKDGNIVTSDSIRGRREVALADLVDEWSGKALTFDPISGLPLLASAEATSIVGGCCRERDGNDPCIGASADCRCRQGSAGPGASGCGSSGGPPPCPTCVTTSGIGRPTWKVNTDNLNLIIKDTPIWYNPGQGPGVSFDLVYNNENPNRYNFGNGWSCLYTMRVFILPGDPVDHPPLQFHLEDGRIETWLWGPTYGGTENRYRPPFDFDGWLGTYGDRETISYVSGVVTYQYLGGPKYYFVDAGLPAEGRIEYIEDQLGKRITCHYTDGKLDEIEDANGRVTTLTLTSRPGIAELVERITLPTDQDYPDGRHADFEYDDSGNLTKITDMGGVASQILYGVMDYRGPVETVLDQDVTTPDATSTWSGSIYGCDNLETLVLDNTANFPSHGFIKLGAEIMHYNSKDSDGVTLRGITRAQLGSECQNHGELAQVIAMAESTLATGFGTEDLTTLTLASVADFPVSGQVKVNNAEIMSYTGKDGVGNTLTGIQRAQEGTQRAAALQGVGVASLKGAVIPAAEGGDLLVQDTAGFPVSGELVVSYGERMSYSGKLLDRFTGVTRAVSSTSMELAKISEQVSYDNVSPTHSTTLEQDVTADPPDPAEGGDLKVGSVAGFPPSGTVFVNGEACGTPDDVEFMTYTSVDDSVTPNLLKGIHRAAQDPTHTLHDILAITWQCQNPVLVQQHIQNPYVSEIITKMEKVKFSYDWFKMSGVETAALVVDGAYEAGPDEAYPQDKTWAFVLDDMNWQTEIKRYTADPAKTLSKTHVTAPNGDALGKVINEEGQTVVEYAYDTRRDVISEKQAADANKVTSYTYNPVTHVRESLTDPLGRTWHYINDAQGRLRATLEPSPKTTLATGITNGSPPSPNDGGDLTLESVDGFPDQGVVLVTNYDGDIELIKYTGRNTSTKKLTGIDRASYDTPSISSMSGSRVSGAFAVNEYNQQGQLTRTLSPYGVTSEMFYQEGYLLYSKDGKGQQTDYHSTENGETRRFLTSVHAPGMTDESQATRYHYDAKGRRDQVTDPNGNVVKYVYDDLDRVIQTVYGSDPETDPSTKSNYSCCGLNWQEDENGRRAYKVYDKKKRVQVDVTSTLKTTLSANITGGASPSPSNGQTLTVANAQNWPTSGYVLIYKEENTENPEVICPGTGLEIIGYSGISGNTLQNITRGVGSPTQGPVPANAYAGDGVALITATVKYVYDSYYDHRLASLIDQNGHATDYEYYKNDRLKKTTYPDGTWESYTYDAVGNVLTKTNGKNAVTDKVIHYDYYNDNKLWKMWP
ncbi:MAG: cysteine peptidase family C39 domain-containing protein [Armatimonadota bacterium]|nr:cysteine peptidase family C39 domain-containing protein [Armatimonadota bacterium]